MENKEESHNNGLNHTIEQVKMYDMTAEQPGDHSDTEDHYSTCDSDDNNVLDKDGTIGDVNDSISAVATDCWAAAPESVKPIQSCSEADAADGAMECSEPAASCSYMPTESLDSDNSDTAGYYKVNMTSNSGNRKRPAYQRGSPSTTSSSDTSSDSDDDFIAQRRRRQMRRLNDMDTESSSDSDTDSVSPKPKICLGHSVLKSVFKREYGNIGRTLNYGSYTRDMMGDVSFVQRLKCVRYLDSHTGCVNALHWNMEGTWLASGSDDLQVAIWNWHSSKPYLLFDSGHRSNVFQCKFMPYSNDSQIVTSARDGQVRLSELSVTGTCRNSKRLAHHKGAAHKLAIENDSPHCLLSAGEDGVTFQIDLRKDKPVKLAYAKNGNNRIPLYSIDKNPTNPYEFLVSGKDQFIRIYDKRKLEGSEDLSEVLKSFCPLKMRDESLWKRDVTCAVYNYNGSEILGSYNDENIHLFDNSHSDGADCIKTYSGHRNNATVKGVNFYGPRSEYIVSGSDCGNVFLWEKQSCEVVQYHEGDIGGVVNVLEPHPHYPFLATSGLDNDIKIWLPIAEQATDLKGLRKVSKRNVREREASREPEEMDGHLLWLIMQHLRQAHSSRRRQANDNGSSDSSEPSVDTSSDEENDGGRLAPNAECSTS